MPGAAAAPVQPSDHITDHSLHVWQVLVLAHSSITSSPRDCPLSHVRMRKRPLEQSMGKTAGPSFIPIQEDLWNGANPKERAEVSPP